MGGTIKGGGQITYRVQSREDDLVQHVRLHYRTANPHYLYLQLFELDLRPVLSNNTLFVSGYVWSVCGCMCVLSRSNSSWTFVCERRLGHSYDLISSIRKDSNRGTRIPEPSLMITSKCTRKAKFPQGLGPFLQIYVFEKWPYVEVCLVPRGLHAAAPSVRAGGTPAGVQGEPLV